MYFTGKLAIFFGIFAIGWAQNAPAPSFPEAPEVYPEAPAPFYPESPEINPESPSPFFPEAPEFYPGTPEVLHLKRSEMERMDENATWMLNETLFEEMDRMNWTMEANFTDY